MVALHPLLHWLIVALHSLADGCPAFATPVRNCNELIGAAIT